MTELSAEAAAGEIYWVFDVLSPFAYLAYPRLQEFPAARVRLVPVLLAAILNHFGQRGPAEIPSKRRFSYRFVLWRARKLGLPMRMPPTHPFNPLGALRLVIAAGSDARAVGTVLDAIFRDGRDVNDPAVLAELAGRLGVHDVHSALGDPQLKARLRANTEWAIGQGIFGVPSFLIGREIFWGHDAIDMALEYLASPAAFDSPLMRAVGEIPVGAVRK